MSEIAVTLFGPLDRIVGPYITYVLLLLVVSNMLTRKLANDSYRDQVAEEGAEALSRHPLHVASTWGLVLASLYYTTLHHHGGMVMSTLVLGLYLTDFFEFESRRVEAAEDLDMERPKAAIVASVVVLLYAAYQSLFFVIAPVWNAVV
jgi:hypothetical protein